MVKEDQTVRGNVYTVLRIFLLVVKAAAAAVTHSLSLWGLERP